MTTIDTVIVEGSPPAWGVTGIKGFIESALARVERGGAVLPDTFRVSFCPWGERNAAAGQLSEIADVFEPQLRLVHFTSCGRPFLIAILSGPDADERQRRAMKHLPWSEHYRGRREASKVTLNFIGESEDVDVDPAESLATRSLRQLFETGEVDDL
jgi:hypothetical protein